MPATSIFPYNTNTYIQSPQLTLSSSSSLCVVRQEGLEQFEQSMLSRIVSLENNEESLSHTIKKLKEDFEMVKRQCKSLTLKEEETRNRIMCKDLSDLLTPHGFTIGPKRLEGFTLPVTEFGTSRNDHCIIHQNYYATEDLKCVIVVPTGQSYYNEEGDAAAGVVEFKNDAYAVDQAIAEMLRTAGDLLLAVLADKKQIRCITIAGLAANYDTGKAKLLKLIINCAEETSEVKQSQEVVPFCTALNIVLDAIKL